MALIDALRAAPAAERVRVDREACRLVGTRCPSCGATSWPARAVCHRCGEAPVEETAFGPGGELLTHTTVWVGRPGLEPPYVLGQVKLDDGPLVFVHVRELPADARVPLRVSLVLAGDAAAVPPFWFHPEEDR